MNEKSIKYLREKVFKTDEYYQFELLFRQAREIEKKATSPIGILERAYIYNGKSIFSSVFSKNEIVPIDYRPISSKEREGFQSAWLEKAGLNCLSAASSIIDTGESFVFKLQNKKIRTLFIPNVLHHCRDFPELLKGVKSRLPALKKIYVFDSYIRENHQDPDDFCRYTPSALEVALKRIGFKEISREESGNVFDCILYFISQAEENLKKPENKELKSCINKALPFLRQKRINKNYRTLGRKYASAATSYSMCFKKI